MAQQPASPLSVLDGLRLATKDGGAFDVEVKDSGTWTWWIAGNPNWISTSEASNQTGDQTFSYHVAPNPTLSSRSAMIFFSRESQVQRHEVVQQPGGLPLSGTVVGWGANTIYNLITIPASVGKATSVTCADEFNVALRQDGTVAAWGINSQGETVVPPGLSDVVAVAAGRFHAMALKKDGTVVAWGSNSFQLRTAAAALTGVVAIAAGETHSLALRNDGTVTAWGANFSGETSLPSNLRNVVAITAGRNHSLAVRRDGTVVAWGSNVFGKSTVPSGLTSVTAVAAGDDHSLALKADGSIVTWGSDIFGEGTVPDTSATYTKIAASYYHSLGIKADGSVVRWGSTNWGQTTVPANLAGAVAISAGIGHSLAVQHVPATFTTTPASRTIVPAGGSYTVEVTASGPWYWIMSGGEGWISTSEASQQSGDQSFGYAVAPNTGVTDRSATITLLSEGVVRTHIINQPAPSIPEIAIKGNATEIVNGDPEPKTENHTEFGLVGIAGTSASRTYTISNSGKGALNLTGQPKIAISGSHAADFSVASMPLVASLATGASLDFRIVFDPSAPGLRAATIKVLNNDADESVFTFTVQGTGAEAGEVAFSHEVYSVNQGAQDVELTLNRTGSTQAFSVSLQLDTVAATITPPFAAAQPGVDFSPLNGTAATVNFLEGETSKTVLLTLMAKSSASTPNKRFSVKMMNPQDGVSLGEDATAAVHILATDTTAPTLTVASPTNKAKISAALPFMVSGMTGDAKGIERVTIKLNDGDALDADLGSAKSLTAVPFSLGISPLEGPNTLIVTAYDLRGNTKQITNTFTFTRRRLLTLTRDTAAAGAVTLAAMPAAAASTLSPAAAQAAVKSSAVLPGTVIKLTAKPSAGFVFKSWSGLPAEAEVTGDMANFVMPQSDVSTTAEFIAPPFTTPSGLANTFQGLLHPAEGTPSTNTTEGFITGSLTAAGSFTGKLFVDGVAQPLTATFFGDGSAVFTSSGKKFTTLAFGSRSLTLNWNNGVINASLTTPAGTSLGSASRAQYGTGSKVPSALLDGPTATKGTYTAAMLSQVQDPPVPLSSYPQGHGFATIALSNTGVAALAMTLADGSSVTGSFTIAGSNTAPFLLQLNTPGSTSLKGGSVSGTLAFDTTQPDSDVTASVLWFRPLAAKTSIVLYNTGWPFGLVQPLIGARYNSKINVQTTLSLGAASPNGNAELLFSEGKLLQPISKTNLNIVGNTVTKIPSSDASFTLTITGSSGAFSGAFVPNWANPATSKPAFKGMILQKGMNKGGYGFFISNAKNDTAPESGGVTLGSP